jgi:hypothetical protein
MFPREAAIGSCIPNYVALRGFAQSAASRIFADHSFQASFFAVCQSSASRAAFHSTSGFFMSLSIKSARVAQTIRLIVNAKRIPPINKYRNIFYLSYGAGHGA